MGNTPSEFIGSFFLYNILFFISIIDKKINIKKQPRDTQKASCQHNLLTICLYQKNNFKIKMNACSCITCLYQIYKFKKIFGDKNNKLLNHCVSIYMSRTCFNLYCTVIHLLIPRSNGF